MLKATLRRSLVPAVLVVAVVSTTAAGQTPRDTGIAILHAGRVFDSEHGTWLGARDIRVHDRTIESIGERLEVPAGARELDLRRYSVLPGLIDSHTHLLYLENPAAGDLTSEGTKAVVVEGLALRALHGAARARTFLAAGITTVRDLGNSGHYGDVALRAAINDGSVDGPRMIVSGPGLSSVNGQFPGLQPAFHSVAQEEYRIIHDPADAADAVRENVSYGAGVIKIYSNNTPNRGSLSIEEMQAIVAAAKRHGVRVAAHATSDDAVWRAASAGVNSVEHAYQVADSTLALMAKNGVALVPTDLDSLSLLAYMEKQPRRAGEPPASAAQVPQFLASQRERLRRAMKAGVMIAAGSDNYIDFSPWPQGQAARHNLLAYAQAGLTPVQVLQAATLNAARLLGMENRIGVLKAGAFADIIAVDGDPGADIGALERVRFTMREGTVYLRPEAGAGK